MTNAHQLKASSSPITEQSLALANSHYENFPVASVFLPQHLREPVGLIYSFARQADDFAFQHCSKEVIREAFQNDASHGKPNAGWGSWLAKYVAGGNQEKRELFRCF